MPLAILKRFPHVNHGSTISPSRPELPKIRFLNHNNLLYPGGYLYDTIALSGCPYIFSAIVVYVTDQIAQRTPRQDRVPWTVPGIP